MVQQVKGEQHRDITHIRSSSSTLSTCTRSIGLCSIGLYSSAQMYLTFKDVQQDVYRVHTDGVVLSKKVDLPLGHGVGEWKVEKEGPCEVVNANVEVLQKLNFSYFWLRHSKVEVER